MGKYTSYGIQTAYEITISNEEIVVYIKNLDTSAYDAMLWSKDVFRKGSIKKISDSFGMGSIKITSRKDNVTYKFALPDRPSEERQLRKELQDFMKENDKVKGIVDVEHDSSFKKGSYGGSYGAGSSSGAGKIVGGAIAGGIIAGPAGAVVGGLVGHHNAKKK